MRMSFCFVAVYALWAMSSVLAAPAAKRSVTTLSSDQFAAFSPFTQFARAAYCPSDKIQNWQCGEACDALPGFEPTLTGGDGNMIQLFFVGYWPGQHSVVVTHEGTDPTAFLSDLTDINFFLTDLDTELFPGVSDSVQVHNGFGSEQAKTAATILAETQRIIAEKGATQVMLVGHSLGGALAELDSVFMKLNLPANINIRAVTYGTPRVGNKAFADLLDSMVPDFVRINNELDVIPIVPGRFLGFQHPHGEVHIVSPGDAILCSGDDDDVDAQCTDKTVPDVFDGNIIDHLGPYDGIFIGTIFCN